MSECPVCHELFEGLTFRVEGDGATRGRNALGHAKHQHLPEGRAAAIRQIKEERRRAGERDEVAELATALGRTLEDPNDKGAQEIVLRLVSRAVVHGSAAERAQAFAIVSGITGMKAASLQKPGPNDLCPLCGVIPSSHSIQIRLGAELQLGAVASSLQVGMLLAGYDAPTAEKAGELVRSFWYDDDDEDRSEVPANGM